MLQGSECHNGNENLFLIGDTDEDTDTDQEADGIFSDGTVCMGIEFLRLYPAANILVTAALCWVVFCCSKAVCYHTAQFYTLGDRKDTNGRLLNAVLYEKSFEAFAKVYYDKKI